MATDMAGPRGLLRHHADFRRLWVAGGISQLGTQVSMLALPLTAAQTLHASTMGVALLSAVQTAAFVVLGLPAGAWSDRMRRRPVLVAADLGRAAALATVPAAALLGVLHIWQLYAVALVSGVGTIFFDVNQQAFVPRLVGREHLVEANGRLETNRSVAATAGPSLAGLLVQALTAPVALAADTLSFLWSAGWIAAIRAEEQPPTGVAGEPLHVRIGAGLRFVLGDPLLRAIVSCGATAMLCFGAQAAIEVLFLLRVVGLPPGGIGLLFSAGSVGTILGALCAAPLTRRIGRGTALVSYVVVAGIGGLLIPLTAPGWRVALFAVGTAVGGFCLVAYNVVQVSMRQARCPDHLLGRMSATMRTIMLGVTPLGAILGGALGTWLGLRATLWCCAVGVLLSSLWLLGSPLRDPDDIPAR
ncbi:MAG TPA: MFS transporter [Rugosimonospora sp.]|nr:MFS transporter [Rugosimonospora sp.]